MYKNLFFILSNLSKQKTPFLTVYLTGESKKVSHSSVFYTQFHSIIKRDLTGKLQSQWRDEIEKIDHYIRESINKSNSKTLVFFVGEEQWSVLNFEFPIQSRCFISKGPYLKPLERSLEAYTKYLVLLADRKRARMFIVHLGEIIKSREVLGKVDVPQRVKAKKVEYGRDDKILRHIEDHLNRHLKIICQNTKEFAKNQKIKFIIIGGHKQLIPKVKECLQHPLNKIVLGEMVIGLDAPLDEILEGSKKIAQKVNKKLELLQPRLKVKKVR